MKNCIFILAALLSLTSLVAQTYITNTTIVDVENQKLIPNQTVTITDDLISNIQSQKKVKLPENATIIDGTGKYLIPGLTDAHIHFGQNGGLYTRPDVIDLRAFSSFENEIQLTKDDMEQKLLRYLKQGITNVIDVGSNLNFLEQRNDFSTNDSLPSIFITGPLLTTYQPKVYESYPEAKPFILTKTIEDGINGVQRQLPYKPDFIKIWYIAGADGLSVEASARKNLPIVKAIINEAHKNKLKVAVHATQRITAQLAVENGADFLVHFIDDEILKDDFVQLMKKNKTIMITTLIVPSGYNNTFAQNLSFSAHELQNADPYQLGSLLDLQHLADTTLINKYKNRSIAQASSNKTSDSIAMANTKILADAGVLLATGTDAGNIGTLHASSYLAELQAMQQSGMSTWQILTASTLNGAKILDQQHEFGTVSVGKKANLVLLDANPVENINNIIKINRVLNNGIVFNTDNILKDTPEDLAQRQLNAYNLRNIDAFLEPYADDVEIYTFPNKLQAKGKEAMRNMYTSMFENTPNLHCELVNRIVQGNSVIDHERVQFGNRMVEAIAIYHMQDGKIKKVYFIQ
ncbi:amidohydrolase family protein [Yeosuana sp. AK3]